MKQMLYIAALVLMISCDKPELDEITTTTEGNNLTYNTLTIEKRQPSKTSKSNTTSVQITADGKEYTATFISHTVVQDDLPPFIIIEDRYEVVEDNTHYVFIVNVDANTDTQHIKNVSIYNYSKTEYRPGDEEPVMHPHPANSTWNDGDYTITLN